MVWDFQTQIAVAIGALVILIALVVRLEIRLNRVLAGKNARTLEDTLITLQKELRELKDFRKDMEQYLGNVEQRLKRCVQGIATVRFNPFKGTGEGGNQSFATAFLDEKGDGVVISSLYSRERVGIYSKPFQSLKSEYELTREEKQAITAAKETASSK